MTSQRATTEWHQHAACATAAVDPDVFFGTDQHDPTSEQLAAAVQLCAQCPVRQQCRDYADDSGEEWGVWAGRHPDELPGRTPDPFERDVARLVHQGTPVLTIASQLNIDAGTARATRNRLAGRRRTRASEPARPQQQQPPDTAQPPTSNGTGAPRVTAGTNDDKESAA